MTDGYDYIKKSSVDVEEAEEAFGLEVDKEHGEEESEGEATEGAEEAPDEEEKGADPMNPEVREAAAELADALPDDCDAEEVIDAVQNRRQAEDREDEKEYAKNVVEETIVQDD